MDGDRRVTSNEDLGQRVRARREFLGLSQERLGALADVARNTVMNIEAGRGARSASVRRIAKALDTDVEGLTAKGHDTTEESGDEGKRWNLLERAQMLRDMAEEYERQAQQEERHKQDRRGA